MNHEGSALSALDLSGRLAIVTGASRGIGAAIVRQLSIHGATVAFCSRNEASLHALAKETRDLGGTTKPYVADLSDIAAADTLFDDVVNDLGEPDILVHNVGRSEARSFLRMTNEDWEALFRVNLGSSLQLTRRGLPHMCGQRWGRIVMISSAAAKFPQPELIAYGASKAAMVSSAKALARRYGKDNVLVNSVLPGLILTDAWTESAGRMADHGIRGTAPEAVLDSFAAEVPLRRYADPAEVAAVVLFLCSRLATYVSGAAIDVDGGWSGHVF